ncbi:type VI secretion system accessory protein TagJ [Neptunomonas sp.]|uniref:type VI secretion system accessory protein TagJ n=1 Tax=Neptunomonas sp. TaxID=1971898 RepID=UPI0025F02ACD|nr:type VI secretion system accessory protein TagJ [Neptunomonas sp.]
MSAETSLLEGNLAAALAELQTQVKTDPAKTELRVFLFQLLSVMGAWDRALTQLKVAGDLDHSCLAMVQTYREALRCEVLRIDVFEGHRSPIIFGTPEPWMAECIQALGLSAQGLLSQAAELRAKGFELAPPTAGTIDGEHFNWIADADSRIGPFLEAVINGHYYWVPFHCIKKVELDPPEDLRDVVWMPAHFVWTNEGESVGLIPTRYVRSEMSDDSLVTLAKKTLWEQKESGEYYGFGQRMLTTDLKEYSLLDMRLIEFNTL